MRPVAARSVFIAPVGDSPQSNLRRLLLPLRTLFVLLALGIDLSAQTFLETFNNAPDYTNNWQVGFNYGGTQLTYTPSNLQMTAASTNPYPPGSAIGLISKQAFVGDIDVSFQ